MRTTITTNTNPTKEHERCPGNPGISISATQPSMVWRMETGDQNRSSNQIFWEKGKPTQLHLLDGDLPLGKTDHGGRRQNSLLDITPGRRSTHLMERPKRGSQNMGRRHPKTPPKLWGPPGLAKSNKHNPSTKTNRIYRSLLHEGRRTQFGSQDPKGEPMPHSYAKPLPRTTSSPSRIDLGQPKLQKMERGVPHN